MWITLISVDYINACGYIDVCVYADGYRSIEGCGYIEACEYTDVCGYIMWIHSCVDTLKLVEKLMDVGTPELLCALPMRWCPQAGEAGSGHRLIW